MEGLFKSLDKNMNYTDILQVDGAIRLYHKQYGKSPIFNNLRASDIAPHMDCEDNSTSRVENKKKNDLKTSRPFDSCSHEIKEEELDLFKHYWLEYIKAFHVLAENLPDSITTIYNGRHAVELGIKYLLLRDYGDLYWGHDLGSLAEALFDRNNINEDYMNWVVAFCQKYTETIEDGIAEYFRYPEYGQNHYFLGTHLDIWWLCENFALILLKLLHYAGIETSEV